MEEFTIEALVISCGEPQLERCIDSINKQTVKFSNIIHIKNVIPEHLAFNTGIEKIEDGWFMKIDGDMILYENALETVITYLKYNTENIFMFSFGLFDEFLQENTMGCNIYNTKLIQTIGYENKLLNDRIVIKKLSEMNYIRYRKGRVIIGTHCSEPDTFQVFRRFYTAAVKYGSVFIEKLNILYQKTQNPLYQVAIDASHLGRKSRYYPTSHNLEFDKKLFNEYLELRNVKD